jgi:ribose transport system substrate-binding protein
VGFNSAGTGVKATVWYETSRCDSGGPADQLAAMFAKKYPGGSVITVGLDGVPSIDSQVACFKAAATKAGLKIIAHVSNTTDDAAGAQKLIGDTITKYPTVNAIWSYNDTSALGASAALISSGKKISDGTSDGVLVTGANGDSDAITAVKQGRLTGTWDPNNTEFGWLFVKVAAEELNGTAPVNSVLASTFIDSSTVKDYVDPARRTVTFDNLKVTTPSS